MKHCGNTCAACGYRHLKLPQRAPSGGASHEICPACGFESGYTDDDQGISYAEWRERWAADGCRWFSTAIKRPDDWNPLKDMQSMLRRKRPVVPPIRLKRAAELLKMGLSDDSDSPSPATGPAKKKVRSRSG